MTHRNAPPQAPFTTEGDDRFARPLPCLADDRVRHYGEPVAYVVAETFEQARAAAALVRVEYAAEPGDYGSNAQPRPRPSSRSRPTAPSPTARSATSSRPSTRAEVQFDETYTTPMQIHAQMEPHASLAWWDGERLVVHCSTQFVDSAHAARRRHADAARGAGAHRQPLRRRRLRRQAAGVLPT